MENKNINKCSTFLIIKEMQKGTEIPSYSGKNGCHQETTISVGKYVCVLERNLYTLLEV
jgi:hypothetical protein